MKTYSNQRVINPCGGDNKDCLNLIRLLAALQVLYGHTLAHLNIDSIPILGEFINFFWVTRKNVWIRHRSSLV